MVEIMMLVISACAIKGGYDVKQQYNIETKCYKVVMECVKKLDNDVIVERANKCLANGAKLKTLDY